MRAQRSTTHQVGLVTWVARDLPFAPALPTISATFTTIVVFVTAWPLQISRSFFFPLQQRVATAPPILPNRVNVVLFHHWLPIGSAQPVGAPAPNCHGCWGIIAAADSYFERIGHRRMASGAPLVSIDDPDCLDWVVRFTIPSLNDWGFQRPYGECLTKSNPDLRQPAFATGSQAYSHRG